MPPFPGEECLLTVFADIHYYFSAPTPRPLHHRFEKGSYLYLYHNATQRRSRIEIANNPNTQDQDAFYGSLSSIHVRNSDKFPTLCTLTVDGLRQNVSGPQSPSGDQHEWRLMSVDPRDGSQSLLRLHTLDIYFWTLPDAKLFVDHARRLLSPNQLDIIAASQPATYETAVHPVVQKLENVVISDSPYHSNSPSGQPQAQPGNVPQPPPAQPRASVVVQPQELQGSSEPVSPLEDTKPFPPTSGPQEQQVNYTPLAYNPAAPAAPETIKPREKTPPPPDAASGTGLAMAAAADHRQSVQSPPMSGGFAIPPPPPLGQGYGGPPTGQLSYVPPPPAADLSQTKPSHHPTGSLSFGPPPHAPTNTSTGSPGAPGMTASSTPPQDPNAHLFGQQSFGSQASVPPPPQQQQQQPHAEYHPGQHQQSPLGGYSNYSYGQPQQNTAPGGSEYDIHNQVYRPTEGESVHHQRKKTLEEGASGIEKKVNKLWKRLEKKI